MFQRVGLVTLIVIHSVKQQNEIMQSISPNSLGETDDALIWDPCILYKCGFKVISISLGSATDKVNNHPKCVE